MIDDLLLEAERRMEHSLDHLTGEFTTVRTGRANPQILHRIEVSYYGTSTPLQQLASFSVPEARLLIVSPYDKGSMGAIEKAIRSSDLGLNPANDGKVVRIPIPPLTDDRRKELSRHIHKQAEEGRNVVRQVRRDANDRLKKLLKEHKISEDDERKGLEQIQKMTDDHVRMIDDLQKKKDQELLGH